MSIADILQQIRPGATWNLRGDDYKGLEWLDESQVKPTEKEILDAATAVQSIPIISFPSVDDFVEAYVSLAGGDKSLMDEFVGKYNAAKKSAVDRTTAISGLVL